MDLIWRCHKGILRNFANISRASDSVTGWLADDWHTGRLADGLCLSWDYKSRFHPSCAIQYPTTYYPPPAPCATGFRLLLLLLAMQYVEELRCQTINHNHICFLFAQEVFLFVIERQFFCLLLLLRGWNQFLQNKAFNLKSKMVINYF